MRFQVWVHFKNATRVQATACVWDIAIKTAEATADYYGIPATVHDATKRDWYLEFLPRHSLVKRSKTPDETYFPDPTAGETETEP
jgi:hypothetical protein